MDRYANLQAVSRNSNDRLDAALNSFTDPALLFKMAFEDRERAVRAAVATNANTPYDALVHLYRERKGRMRKFLARNPALPENISVLLLDESDETRAALRKFNRNPAVLARLSDID